MSAEATSHLPAVEVSRLMSYPGLPGELKSRLAPLLPNNQTLSNAQQAEAKFNELVSAERLSTHAAALALIQRYTIITTPRQQWYESASDFVFGRTFNLRDWKQQLTDNELPSPCCSTGQQYHV